MNRGLAWKVLAKEDRYDTSYYNAQLEEMKKAHPNLTVENNLHCFVSWPVFNQDDIARTFFANSSTSALQFDIDENT